jgi:hypothetical protein
MKLRINIAGEIVERQELLNGTQTIALEGAGGGGEWTMSGALSWNRGLVDFAGEGDLTLSRSDGSEVFATLMQASVTDAQVAGSDDDGAADHLFAAKYEVDGGSGAFEGARGDGEASGSLSGDRFRGTWLIRIEAS